MILRGERVRVMRDRCFPNRSRVSHDVHVAGVNDLIFLVEVYDFDRIFHMIWIVNPMMLSWVYSTAYINLLHLSYFGLAFIIWIVSEDDRTAHESVMIHETRGI
jgi:hypothetical protein